MKFNPMPQSRPAEEQAAGLRACDHPGCAAEGVHRAPRSRNPADGYYWFCLDHAREYNRNWNFFAGMSPHEIEHYRRQDMIGHRPTWRMGVRDERGFYGRTPIHPVWVRDDLGLLGEVEGLAERFGERETAPPHAQRRLNEAEKAALARLDLDGSADKQAIKARYKALAKQFHPDRNKGDKAAEERMKHLTQAYALLMRSDAWG